MPSLLKNEFLFMPPDPMSVLGDKPDVSEECICDTTLKVQLSHASPSQILKVHFMLEFQVQQQFQICILYILYAIPNFKKPEEKEDLDFLLDQAENSTESFSTELGGKKKGKENQRKISYD